MKTSNDVMTNVLRRFPDLEVKFAEPLNTHTYTKLGGPADIYAAPSHYTELTELLRETHAHQIPTTLIGSGANLIVKDGGIRGITISLANMKDIRTDNLTIYAGAGAALKDVSAEALQAGLSGLEFACGIPGTVGGALYMNAGAYGGQISDVLVKAIVMDEEGKLLELSNKELEFGYRSSRIARNKYIVLEAEFELVKADSEAIKAKMQEFTAARESKQPLEYPSCGSVFKRPPGYFAGQLIQDCGLQGLRIGGAEVSTKHAGFIVNVDHAASQDYIDLIRIIQETVKQKFDVTLETEVIIIGEDLS